MKSKLNVGEWTHGSNYRYARKCDLGAGFARALTAKVAKTCRRAREESPRNTPQISQMNADY
jgi:hypothetical protein